MSKKDIKDYQPEMISVPVHEHRRMLDAVVFYKAMQDSNIRDWSGYDEAIERYKKIKSKAKTAEAAETIDEEVTP